MQTAAMQPSFKKPLPWMLAAFITVPFFLASPDNFGDAANQIITAAVSPVFGLVPAYIHGLWGKQCAHNSVAQLVLELKEYQKSSSTNLHSSFGEVPSINHQATDGFVDASLCLLCSGNRNLGTLSGTWGQVNRILNGDTLKS